MFFSISFSRIKALIIKELIAILRDPKTRFILIGPPLLQLFVFAFAATLDVKNVSIGILNLDSGEKGFELVQRIKGSPTFTHIYYLDSALEIADFMDNQRATALLSINEEFSRNLDAKKKTSLQLILDGRKSNSAQIVAGYIADIVSQFAADVEKNERIGMEKVELFPRNWFNPNLIYYWFTVPGLLGILVMVEALLLTGLAIARERELGTFDQLLVSPLTPREILIGKALPAIFLSMIEGVVILLISTMIFRIPFVGSVFLILISMLVFIISIVGVGLYLSSLAYTQQQAILASFIFLTPAVLLSGFATPIENMPIWLQYLTYLNPARYFETIARGLYLKQLPASFVFLQTGPMMMIGIVTLAAASLSFRSKLA